MRLVLKCLAVELTFVLCTKVLSPLLQPRKIWMPMNIRYRRLSNESGSRCRRQGSQRHETGEADWRPIPLGHQDDGLLLCHLREYPRFRNAPVSQLSIGCESLSLSLQFFWQPDIVGIQECQ